MGSLESWDSTSGRLIVGRSAYGGGSASNTTMAALTADTVKSRIDVFIVFPSRTIRTRTIAWQVSRGGSQSLNWGCLNALYWGISGLERKKGDNQSVVTGSLQSLNSDHKVPYTIVPFLYQYFTRETYSVAHNNPRRWQNRGPTGGCNISSAWHDTAQWTGRSPMVPQLCWRGTSNAAAVRVGIEPCVRAFLWLAPRRSPLPARARSRVRKWWPCVISARAHLRCCSSPWRRLFAEQRRCTMVRGSCSKARKDP